MSDSNSVQRFSWTTGAFWIILGLLLALVSAYRPEWTVEGLQAEVNLARKLFESLGISLLLFGLFSIILQTRDWREYFEENISNIIVHDSYLKRLSDVELTDLQNRLLVRQLGDGEIDPERSFLGYFHRELHHLLSEPYRENVENEMILEETDRDGFLRVADNISYTCREVGGQIQSKVGWSLDSGEVEAFISLRVEVKKPLGPDGDVFEVLFDSGRTELKRQKDGGYKIELDIPAEFQVDGVKVNVRSRYFVAVDRFHYWEMAQATKGFCFILRFPLAFQAQTWAFVQSGSRIDRTDEPGYRKIRYDAWMLPNNGITWFFRPTRSNASVPDASFGISEPV